MPLTAMGIKKAGDGRLSDGEGLSLEKKGSSGKWIWRYSFSKKRREMGLGTWPTVSLADARKERDKWKVVLSQGKDPVSERKSAKAAALAELSRKDPTLEELTEEVFETYKCGFRNSRTAISLSPGQLFR